MPLKADPAKTAAFQARGRATGLKRTVLSRSRSRRRAVTPPDVWREVWKRDGGRCVWSRYLGEDVKAEHPHHLLPRSTWPMYVKTRQNIVGLAAHKHMQHEWSPTDRLPWAALPPECQAFLLAVAKIDPRAERFIETKYPAGAGQSEHPVRGGRDGR